MGFVEAAGSNRLNGLPCFQAPYFSKKGQAKMLEDAILEQFQSMKRELQGQYVTISTVGEDVHEVGNYVAALDFGLKRLGEGLPLNIRQSTAYQPNL
jgi:hypothetical protein